MPGRGGPGIRMYELNLVIHRTPHSASQYTGTDPTGRLTNPQDPLWNRFCRKCTIDAQPTHSTAPDTLQLGTHFTFDVHLNPGEPDGTTGQAIALEVSVLEPIAEDGRKGWRIAWKQRAGWLTPAWMLRSERVQEFVELDGGAATDYRCWETFYGLLAPVVNLAAGKQVEKGFVVWEAGLKARAEGGGKGPV